MKRQYNYVLALVFSLLAFTASAQITTYPYVQDFDGFTSNGSTSCSPTVTLVGGWSNETSATEGTSNTDWTNRNTSTGSGSTGPSGDHTGSGYYLFTETSSGCNGRSAYMRSPVFNFTSLTNPELEFWYHMYGATMGTLDVVVSTDGGLTWSPSLWTLSGNQGTSWQKATVSLCSYAGQASVLVRFAAVTGSSFTADMAIDDVTVYNSTSTACVAPSPSGATGLTSSGATLTWGDVCPVSYDWQVVPSGNGQGTGVVASGNVTGASAAATGLMDNTSYDYYVRSICGTSLGDTSAWSSAGSFTTLCTPYTVPYAEGFEMGYTYNTPIGGCLSQASVTGAQTWDANDGTVTSNNRSPRTGGWHAFLRYSNEDWLFIPIALTGGVSYTAEVYAKQDGTNTNNSDVGISYGTTNTAAGMTNAIVAPVGIDNNYQLIRGTFTPTTTGVYFIGIKGYMNSSPWYISIDDIAVYQTPTCPEVTSGVATNVKTDSATIGWTEAGTATVWEVEYGTAGFTQGMGTVINNVTTNPYNLSGLMPATSYEFYVRSVCSPGDTSSWGGPYTFATAIQTAQGVNCVTPGAVSTVLFSEEFDNNSAGWTGDIGTAGGDWEIPDGAFSSGTGATNAHSGANYMNYEASGGIGTGSIVSPAIDLASGVDDAELSFWMHAYGADMGTLEVGIGTSANGPFTTVFTQVGQLQTSGTAPWQNVGVNLAAYLGQTIYVEFKQTHTTGFAGDMSIDLIEVKACVSCVAPSALSATNLTDSTATLGWTENSPTPATQWQIEYGTPGFTQGMGMGTSIIVNSNPYTLTGLMGAGNYEYYVRAVCSPGDTSGWGGPVAFTTPCSTPLAGTYTIGMGGDYASFAAAANALEICGISGAITFNVMAGTYTESFSLGDISGTSATNTVTFNGNGAATINYDASSGQNAIILVDGADYVTFRAFTLNQTKTATDAWGIRITNESDYLNIERNTINMAASTTFDRVAIVASGSATSSATHGDHCDFLTIDNNTINGGYTGIQLEGRTATADFMKDATISNNTINGVYYAGIFLDNQDGIAITGNTIDATGDASVDGLYFFNIVNFQITDNNITATDDGIYLSDANFDGIPTARGKIINNFVHSTEGDACWTSDLYESDVWHNTFTTASTSAAEYAFYVADNQDVNVQNNIFVANQGAAFYSTVTLTNFTINYNIYHSNGTILIDAGANSHNTLAAWKTGQPAYNVNSIEGLPIFRNYPTDLHATDPLADNVGTPVGVLLDIDGETRSTTTPDIGADEFSAVQNDVVAVEVLYPMGCATANDTIMLVVQNKGQVAITSLSLSANVTGNVTTTTSNTATGLNIPFLGTDTVMVGTIDATAGGNFTVQAFTMLMNDEDVTNDTAMTNVAKMLPGAIITNVSCNGANDGSITAFPDNGATVTLTNSKSDPNINENGGTTVYNFTVPAGTVASGTLSVETIYDLGAISVGEFLDIRDENGNLLFTHAPNTGDCQLTNESFSFSSSDFAAWAADGTITFNVITGSGVDDNVCGSGYIELELEYSAPSTYLWSTGATTATISGLAPGNYTVTVTDGGGCTNSNTFSITEPAVLMAMADSTMVSCNGGMDGTATAMVTGGTMPYTYAWSDNATTTATLTGMAGTYSVTVTDANGCTDSASTTITEPAMLMVTATPTAMSAPGVVDGSVATSVSGGTMPYAYSWSNGATTSSLSNLSFGTYDVTVTDANGCTATATATVVEPGPLAVAITLDSNVSCNGLSDGGATAVITGGGAPYTYAWSTGDSVASISGVMAGTYVITITDGQNIVVMDSITITEPATLVATATIDSNVTCNGLSDGGATASATGGTMPYMYMWSNSATTASITGIAAGTYIVTITDANGCSSVDTAVITEPMTLTTSTMGNDITCNGQTDGNAKVMPMGGTMPYSYMWSNGMMTDSIAGLAASTYMVTVTDANGCMAIDSVVITEPMLFTASSAFTNVNCNGGSDGTMTITGMGGTMPYSYTWSDTTIGNTGSATGLVAGSYTVTVTDANACTTYVFTETITEPAMPVALSATTGNIGCIGDSTGSIDLTVMGGTAGYSYSWSNGANSQDLTGLPVGTYTVTVTDANGCTETLTRTITQAAGIATNIAITDITCNGNADGTISMTVSGGTAPYTYLWSNSATTANLTGLTGGVYTVTITDANGCTATASTTITDPGMLMANGMVTVSACNSANGGTGGTIMTSVSGGTAPFSYAWSNGATTSDLTGVTDGTYHLTITDVNGCTATDSFVVVESPTFAVGVVIDQQIACPGGVGQISAFAFGGTAPYAGAILDAQGNQVTDTVFAAGTYVLIAFDANGCFASDTFDMVDPIAVSITSIQAQNVLCSGQATGSITVNATGGTGALTYNWSAAGAGNTNNPTNLGAGAYSVTITDDNGCSVTGSATIGEPSSPLTVTTAYTSDTNGTSMGQINAAIAGGTPPYALQWDDANNSTTNTVVGVPAGTYTVTVTDANGCQETGTVVVDNFNVNTTSIANITNLGIFPNPTRGNVTIQLELAKAADVNVKVYDLTGKEVADLGNYRTTNEQFNLNLSNYASGVYLVRFIIDGDVVTRKLVLEK